MIKGAIFILTQNTTERKVYLKTSLYFLFKNFNAKYKYPVIILHEGDYTEDAKKEIIAGIRGECRNLLKFQQIDDEDIRIPSHIDIDKMGYLIGNEILSSSGKAFINRTNSIPTLRPSAFLLVADFNLYVLSLSVDGTSSDLLKFKVNRAV